ncbi:MAG: Eco29kI family restriction endonuclease [Gammaproteobacteria bacterium]
MAGDPYNPLDKMNLGRSVSEALLLQPVAPLSETADLFGAGVYAIYYTGDFEPYRPVADQNAGELFRQPIYVGKAVPKGARKGGTTFDASKGRAARDRLRQHANSIMEAKNLDLDDFQFRSLVVDDIWIPLGENMMIEKFKPVWNLVIDGFGNKDPGARRATQYRSPWDVLHPGRKFAEKLAQGEVTRDALVERINDYFAGHTVPLVPPDEAADEGTSEESL